MSTGRLLNELVPEYQAEGKLLIGFEQDLGSGQPLPDYGNRRGRFFQVYQSRGGGGSVATPMFMIDGGRDIMTGGAGDMDKKYRDQFDSALARPAKADIQAWFERTDSSSMTVQVDIQNVGDEVLSPFDNNAGIVVFLYDEEEGFSFKGTVKWAQRTPLDDDIGPGERASMDLSFDNVEGVNFQTSRMVVMLDYKPGEDWDTANSAFAEEGTRPTAPPVLRITKPTSGSEFVAGEPIEIETEVENGPVDLVVYYAGNTWVGEATEPPYAVTWTDSTPGSYTLTAETTVGDELFVSEAVEVTITEAGAPTEPPEPTAVPTEPPVEPTEPPGETVGTIYLPMVLRNADLSAR